MKLLKLYSKNGDEAIVEPDSQGEKECRANGFSDKKPAKSKVDNKEGKKADK